MAAGSHSGQVSVKSRDIHFVVSPNAAFTAILHDESLNLITQDSAMSIQYRQ
jgi:hypothetical protein